jgi:hypothetical protein
MREEVAMIRTARFSLTLCFSGLLFGSVAAQVEISTPNQTVPNQQVAQPPKNLGEMLPSAYWNVEEWGVLLSVSPEYTLPKYKPDVPQVPLPPPPPRGYNLANILTFFDYQTIKSGTVAAVAPVFMRVFTRPTIAPEDAVSVGKEEAGAELFASFTPAQWQMVGSANGIGRGDLAPKQQKLYDVILPENGTLYPQYRPPKPGETPTPPQQPIKLTPVQISQFRLRIARKVNISYGIEGMENNGGFVSFGDNSEETGGYFLSESAPDPEESQDPLVRKMYPKVLNRLKPSDIDYKSARLSIEISLKDIKTVDDLVSKIGQATKLTLLADAHVGKCALYLRGDSARAGDLLQALCLATLGTFRKMGEGTFLLTENQEGLGTRMTAYKDWQQQIQTLRSKRQEKRNEAMKKNGVQLPFDDPYGLSDAVKEKIKSRNYGFPGTEKGIDTNTLPEKLKKIIDSKKDQTIHVGDGTSTTPVERKIRTDSVFLRSQPQAFFLLQGVGQFQANVNAVYSLNDNQQPIPEPPNAPKTPVFTLPEVWKKRALIATVRDKEEAKKIVQLAHEGGFNKIWLVVPPLASKSKPLLEEAIRLAKPKNIAIGVMFNPLSASKTNDPLPYTADCNIYGETSDAFALRVKDNPQYYYGQSASQVALAPTPNNLARLQKEMVQIAATPQLLGALVQSNPPAGYGKEDYYWGYGNPMGYHYENRMAFLQKERVDPVDILPNPYEQPPVTILYFHTDRNQYMMLPNGQYGPNPDNKDWLKAWHDFLGPQAINLNTNFYTALAQSKTPLYLQLSNTDLIVPWQKAEMVFKQPPYKQEEDYSLAQTKAAQKLSPIVFRRMTPWGNDIKQWEEGLGYYTQSDAKNTILQGVIFDFSGLSLEQMSAYLQVLQKKIEGAKK